MIKNYKDIEGLAEVLSIMLKIYRVTKGFPKEELYGLTSLFRK